MKPTDDQTTIKRAYRKLMSEHHPDKLVAKGLPPEMMEMAKQKAQEIQKAYELIKEKKVSNKKGPDTVGPFFQKSTGALNVIVLPKAGWVMVSVWA